MNSLCIRDKLCHAMRVDAGELIKIQVHQYILRTKLNPQNPIAKSSGHIQKAKDKPSNKITSHETSTSASILSHLSHSLCNSQPQQIKQLGAAAL